LESRNLTNNRYANFGTFAERGAVAGNLSINDPRTPTLAQPLSIYAGLTYRFGPEPVAMPPALQRLHCQGRAATRHAEHELG
jgi:hypothetical protein